MQLYRKPCLIVFLSRCLNYIGSQGNERWVEALDHDFHREFSTAKTEPWVTIESGKVAGTVRSAGGKGKTTGNVTFVTVYEAGYDVRLCE